MSIISDPNAGAPLWLNYKGTSQLVGVTQSRRVTVYVDPTLGLPGLQNAQFLVGDADRVAGVNDGIFGTIGEPVSVIVFALGGTTNGTGGADHSGCNYATGAAIEVCASFGQGARVSALFEAELSECSMNGNLCGLSTGEGLSRWCAAITSNNALSDFATAPEWYQSGTPDFVNNTDPTDKNGISTGNTMAYLSWLMSLGFGLNQIAQIMVSLGDAGTLAQLYAVLTSNSAFTAWATFISAVQALPGIVSDDPFGAHFNASDRAVNASLRPASVGDISNRVASGITPSLKAGAKHIRPPKRDCTICSHRLAHPSIALV